MSMFFVFGRGIWGPRVSLGGRGAAIWSQEVLRNLFEDRQDARVEGLDGPEPVGRTDLGSSKPASSPRLALLA